LAAAAQFQADDGSEHAGTGLDGLDLPATANLLFYPADSAAREYDSRTPTYLRSAYDEVAAPIQQLRS
jgi:hypothetical protein